MSKSSLLVSIIVPVYNAEVDLDRCLSSLISLEYMNDYEVILVDDGSKDNSGKICDKYEEKYGLFKVVHQKNAGVSTARNVGVEQARGKYIMFVDADDYLMPSAMQSIIYGTQTNCDLIIYDSFFDTGVRKIHSYPEIEKIKERQALSIDITYSMFLKLQNNEPFSKLYLTRIIKETQVRFPVDVKLGEDLIFTLQFLERVQKVTYVPEAIYMHIDNISGLSKQNTSLKVIGDYDAMYNAMLSFVSKMNIEDRHYNEVIASILQSVTNYSGKLYTNGYSKNKITAAFKKCPWYNMILWSNYSEYKSKLRKLLLKNRWYFIISKIFNK